MEKLSMEFIFLRKDQERIELKLQYKKIAD